MLLNALTLLLSKKKINQISVTELAELADINRATFYLYYKDVFDMVDQLENETLSVFTQSLNQFHNVGRDYDNTLGFYTNIFNFIKENSELIKILLGPNGDQSIREKLYHAIREFYSLDQWNCLDMKQYMIPFLISGCIGIIQKWLEDGLTVSPNDMAKFVVEMTLNRD
jgi:AcrR family transcriptional regulator